MDHQFELLFCLVEVKGIYMELFDFRGKILAEVLNVGCNRDEDVGLSLNASKEVVVAYEAGLKVEMPS